MLIKAHGELRYQITGTAMNENEPLLAIERGLTFAQYSENGGWNVRIECAEISAHFSAGTSTCALARNTVCIAKKVGPRRLG